MTDTAIVTAGEDFETIGEAEYDAVGDDEYYAADGADGADELDVIGARRRRRLPRWRARPRPHARSRPQAEQMEILPLAPNVENGVFSASVSTITYTGKPQRWFRGERLVVLVSRAGTTTPTQQLLCSTFQIGSTPQLVQVGSFPIECFSPNAFGVRLAMTACGPGVEVTLTVEVATPLSGDQKITCNICILGRSVR